MARARREHTIVRIAFVSTFPPHRCGVASFTGDLGRVTWDREFVAIEADGAPPAYPLEVHHRIRRDEPADHTAVAAALDACADVVSIQHASGLWGGPAGSFVLDFARGSTLPAVVTLHSVSVDQLPAERGVMAELASLADAVVVMSQAAMRILVERDGIARGRIWLIPHGLPDLPLVASDALKPRVGMEGGPLILSFGLLGPDKGCEVALDAMPAVIDRHPTARYIVLGPTRPDLVGPAGEDPYRDGLVDRARRLGVSGQVSFIDRFVGRVELTRWLEAADVVVAPYPDLERTVSGALGYAMGAGRPVVATPFPYAEEMLADGCGVVVPSGVPEALGVAVCGLLEDDEARLEMGRRAHARTRPMIWSAVGDAYRALFETIAARGVPRRRRDRAFREGTQRPGGQANPWDRAPAESAARQRP